VRSRLTGFLVCRHLEESERVSLGAHVSTAGGVDKAPGNGRNLGCEAIQVFTRNQLQWRARSLAKEEVASFRQEMDSRRIKVAVAHDSYLINLGSPEAETLRKSLEAFADEMERCELLGIPYLVFHPGSHLGVGEAAGLKRIAESINRVLRHKKGAATQVLLETTAGQGTSLGYRFEQLAAILDEIEVKDRVGVCVDTCHLYAAGYDFRTRAAYDVTFHQLDQMVGLKKVKAFHLNDSKKGLGSRIDRHENIGKGELGLDAFGFLLNDPRFAGLPMLLETPGGDESYRRDLKTLRRLVDR
jgi:deoxyribonuclease IV